MNPSAEDSKLLNNLLADDDSRFRLVMHKIAQFVASYELVEEKLRERERALEARLLATEKRFGEQLSQIQTVLDDFQSIMTEAGAARWRIAAEKALKNGEDHVVSIRHATNEFVEKSKETFTRLDNVTEKSVKGLADAIQLFKADDFQNVANDSVKMMKNTCSVAVRKVSDIIRWFHWRNLGMVLSVTLIVTMITGLYLNDEWPWETHKEVMQQRNLAQAVISAWPHLDNTDQQEILNTVNKRIS